MAYITHAQLHDRPGSRELAQVASDEHKPLVAYELMEAALLGGDLDAWPTDDVALANEALARIDDAIADAGGQIDGYLRKRGYTIPYEPVPRLLTTIARALVRYYLNKDRGNLESDDTIVRDYKDAMKQLQSIAEGKVALGADDAIVETGVGMPLISAGCRPVRNALKDF